MALALAQKNLFFIYSHFPGLLIPTALADSASQIEIGNTWIPPAARTVGSVCWLRPPVFVWQGGRWPDHEIRICSSVTSPPCRIIFLPVATWEDRLGELRIFVKNFFFSPLPASSYQKQQQVWQVSSHYLLDLRRQTGFPREEARNTEVWHVWDPDRVSQGRSRKYWGLTRVGPAVRLRGLIGFSTPLRSCSSPKWAWTNFQTAALFSRLSDELRMLTRQRCLRRIFKAMLFLKRT